VVGTDGVTGSAAHAAEVISGPGGTLMDFTATQALSEHRRQSFLAEADAHRQTRAHRRSSPRAGRTRRSVRRFLPVRRWRPAYEC
jgi:hypothetical protein